MNQHISTALVVKLSVALAAVAALFIASVLAITSQPEGNAVTTGFTDRIVTHTGAPTSDDGLVPEVKGSLREFVPERHRPSFDAMMSNPEARSEFFGAFQDGVDSVQDPSRESRAQNVLAFGYNNGVWVTASYADMARGLIWGAVQYCKRYVPAWACQAAGNWLTSMARGYAPMNNHGIWGKVGFSGYTGGRW